MIPFEEFAAALERYKLRKQAAAQAAAPQKVPSGKPAQSGPRTVARGDQSAIEVIEEL